MRERVVGAHVVCAPDELELLVTEFSQVFDDEVDSSLLRANEEFTGGFLVVVLTVDYVLSCILVKGDVELGSF